MERYEEIERSITTRFRARIWSKFVKAIKDYQSRNRRFGGLNDNK